MNNCNNMRITGPSGVWEYDQLIGGKVRLKSLPISNFFGSCSSITELMTIEDILFRISLDGKTITLVILKEFPGKFFTWKDLEVVEINTSVLKKPICGTFNSGQAICGKGVSTEPSYLENLNGIVVIDSNGNTISNRYIRFLGADVEDITSDKDDITDVNFGGDVLD